MASTCNAKTRAGTPCARHPAVGRTRCKLHGGASLCGREHWNFKDGCQTRAARAETAAGFKRLRALMLLAKMLGMIR